MKVTATVAVKYCSTEAFPQEWKGSNAEVQSTPTSSHSGMDRHAEEGDQCGLHATCLASSLSSCGAQAPWECPFCDHRNVGGAVFMWETLPWKAKNKMPGGSPTDRSPYWWEAHLVGFLAPEGTQHYLWYPLLRMAVSSRSPAVPHRWVLTGAITSPQLWAGSGVCLTTIFPRIQHTNIAGDWLKLTSIWSTWAKQLRKFLICLHYCFNFSLSR